LKDDPEFLRLETQLIARKAWRELAQLYLARADREKEPAARAEALTLLAELLETELNDPAGAARVYGQIVSLTGERAALAEQVRLLSQRDDEDGWMVRRVLDDAVQRAPNPRARAAALLVRGERLLASKELARARVDFEAVEALTPGSLLALIGLARCATEKDRARSAERLRAVLATTPRRAPHRLEGLRCLAELAGGPLANARLARWAWTEVLAEQPEDPQAPERLLELARRLGDKAELARLLRTRIAREPRGPVAREARLELVATLEAEGQRDEALAELRHAVRFEPGHKEAWLLLVERLIALGKSGEAAWALEHAATATEDEAERQRTWERLARFCREVLGDAARAQVYANRAENLRKSLSEPVAAVLPPEPRSGSSLRRSEPGEPRTAVLVPVPGGGAPARQPAVASDISTAPTLLDFPVIVGELLTESPGQEPAGAARASPPPREATAAPPPKEREVITSPPPKEREATVAPTAKEREAAASASPREREVPVAPAPKEREAAASPSPKEREVPVAPPPKERELTTAPSPKEREATVPGEAARPRAPATTGRPPEPAPVGAASPSPLAFEPPVLPVEIERTQVISWEAPPGKMEPARRRVRGNMGSNPGTAVKPAPPQPAAETRPAAFERVHQQPLDATAYREIAAFFASRGDTARSTLMAEVAEALRGELGPSPIPPRRTLTAEERAGLRHPGLRNPAGELLTTVGLALCRLFPVYGRAAGSSEPLRPESGPGARTALEALQAASRLLDLPLPEVVLAEDDAPPFSLVHASAPRILVGRHAVERALPEPELRFFAGRAVACLGPDLLALRCLKKDQLLRAVAILVSVLRGGTDLGPESRVVRDSLHPAARERALRLLEAAQRAFDATALADAARHSANRAGLVVCGGVGPALAAMRSQKASEQDQVELVRFAASERYLPLRG
jgi:hypothetical protein